MGIKKDQKSKEQFIKHINVDDIMAEIIGADHNKKENEITSEYVLAWARRVEA